MSHLSVTLTALLTEHPSLTLRQISLSAGINTGCMSQFRTGDRRITLTALQRLLPVIQEKMGLHAALRLHIAYLEDETLDDYRQHLQTTATTPEYTTSDRLTATLKWIHTKASSDVRFHAWITGLWELMQPNGSQELRKTATLSAPAPLLSEIAEAVGAIAELQGRATGQGQHVVAAKLQCARDELRSAVGSWNHGISDNA